MTLFMASDLVMTGQYFFLAVLAWKRCSISYLIEHIRNQKVKAVFSHNCHPFQHDFLHCFLNNPVPWVLLLLSLWFPYFSSETFSPITQCFVNMVYAPALSVLCLGPFIFSCLSAISSHKISSRLIYFYIHYKLVQIWSCFKLVNLLG